MISTVGRGRPARRTTSHVSLIPALPHPRSDGQHEIVDRTPIPGRSAILNRHCIYGVTGCLGWSCGCSGRER